MELNGALSSPCETDKSLLIRLYELRAELLKQAAERPLEPRQAPARAAPVLETVTLVLELADRQMRVCEIHAAANGLLGAPLRWRSVKGILSAYTIGGDRRFRRERHGLYELAALSRAGSGNLESVQTRPRPDDSSFEPGRETPAR
jgi:hypothetical protein